MPLFPADPGGDRDPGGLPAGASFPPPGFLGSFPAGGRYPSLSGHRRIPRPARPAVLRDRAGRYEAGRDGTVQPRLLVPAYFHPAVAPDDWAAMARQADQIRAVVLNPASGPGDRPDPACVAAIAPLRAAGIALAGYADTNYGRRPAADALEDIRRYQEWYGVSGVMFDRVSAGLDNVRHYSLLARRARKLGVSLVVFNHGVHPHEAYARHADVLGTFEGPWRVYLEQAVPRWTRSWPAARFYHVVYSVPPAELGNALLLAGRRRAGWAFATDASGGNPYRRLPATPPAAA